LFLSRPGGQERDAVDGAEGKPGRDQGVRASGIRGLARAVSAYAIARAQGAGGSVPHLGSASRRAEDEVTQLSESETRSVAAIGNSCVIPAQAGIQVSMLMQERYKLGPRPAPGRLALRHST